MLHIRSQSTPEAPTHHGPPTTPIRRKDSGDDSGTYRRGLAAEAGVEGPSDEDLRRRGKKRKGQTVPEHPAVIC